MNYDKYRHCFQCQKMKLREGFGPKHPGTTRQVCEECRERSAQGDETIAERQQVEDR